MSQDPLWISEAEVVQMLDLGEAIGALEKALVEEARRYPGQERKVMEYYRNNPDAIGQLRAPIFEDKVVDFIVELAKTSERQVKSEELLRDPEDTETGGAGG